MAESIVESSAETVLNVSKTERVRVLHVDDDQGFLKVAKQCLDIQGEFEVDTASSVNEASEKLKKTDYDIIVSDYHMPDKDGLEFLKELREKGNTVPFIVFTGKGREELPIKELFSLGADGYFEKHGEPEAVYRELAHGISEVVEKKRIKDALRSSQAKYQSLLQNIPCMVFRARPDWSTEIIANSKNVCGYTIQEFDSGRVNWLDIIHPDDKARVAKEADIILERPASITQEYRIVDKESGVRWVEDHKTSSFSKNGVFEGIDGIVFDVTSRKKAEQALNASLDRYRSFIEVTEQLGWTTDANGEVVEDLPSFRKFTGQTYEEIEGHGWLKALHPDDVEQVTRIWKEAIATKSKYEVEYRLRRNDGVYRYFTVRGVPVPKEDGSIREWVGTCMDVTERRKEEQTLKESEEKYRSLVELAPDGILAVSAEGIVTSVNGRALELVGYDSAEEIVGTPFMELKTMRMEDIPKFQSMFKSLMNGEPLSPVEFFYVRRDGTGRWAEVHPSLLIKDGKPVGAQVIMRDVSARKKVEEEKSRLLHDLQDSVKELNCLYGMSRLFEKSDISLDDTLQKTADLLPPAMQYPDITCARIVVENRVFSTKNFKETRWKLQADIKVHEKKAGLVEICYLEERPTIAEGPFLKEERLLIDAVAERLGKIIEREKAEEALQISEEHGRFLFEFQSKVIDTAMVWINLLDREGNVTLWNRAAELISGYTREEVTGHNKIWEWLYADPQYRTEVFARAKRIIDEKLKMNFETEIKCKDGASKTISWYTNSITDGKGKPVGSIAIGLDVSQLKKAEGELQETMKKLQVMNEKLRVVGGLTRHDVRNKLTAVTGNAYLARKKLPGNSEVLDYMRQIETSVEQTMRIFDFAKVYEMLGIEQLMYVDLERAVNDGISLFPDLKGIKIVNDCHGLTVLADSLLTQLFYNLVDNSLKYGKKLSSIRIYYEEKHNHMNVIYEDDGVGIPAAEKPKLFNEGYSTGGSTGYGLYLIKKMTEVYGWTIQETGEPGKGARFIVRIPEMNTDGKENYRIA